MRRKLAPSTPVMFMNKKRWLLLSGVALACLLAYVFFGVAGNHVPRKAVAALENAEQYELLSLEPHPGPDAANTFHGYPVLGRMLITDGNARANLTRALRTGASENQNTVAACFNPRHGLHVVGKSGAMDFVICFECRQVKVFENELRTPGFLTSPSPKPVFDAVLKKAGVPLAEEAH